MTRLPKPETAFTAMGIAAGAWALAACCSPAGGSATTQAPPAPTTSVAAPAPVPPPVAQQAPAAPRPAKPLLQTPSSEAELDALIQSAGCLFASPSGRVACLRAPADMGYTTVDLRVVDEQGERDRFTLYGYASMVFDDKALHPEGFAGANAFLRAGKFRRGGKAVDAAAASVEGKELVVKHAGKEAKAPLPSLPEGDATTDALDAHVAACCKWKPEKVWSFDDPSLAAVQIYRSCMWTRTPAKGVPKVCVDPDHNAENYVAFDRVLVVPFGK
jgi:hypothetical protein